MNSQSVKSNMTVNKENNHAISNQPSNLPLTTRSIPNIESMNTVIIFDFDDTLFPTSKFMEISTRPNRMNCGQKKPSFRSKMTAQEMTEFIKLSWMTYNLLSSSIAKHSKQNIYIVTSSSPGWIKKALSLVQDIGYYPYIYDLIFKRCDNDYIQIINPSEKAMKQFESINRIKHKAKNVHGFIWKYKAFNFILNKKLMISDDQNVVNTFVIIGDSSFEYEAAKNLSKHVEKVYGENNKKIFIHRIKLISEPSINVLIQEQTLLYQLSESRHYEKHSLFIQNNFWLKYNQIPK